MDFNEFGALLKKNICSLKPTLLLLYGNSTPETPFTQISYFKSVGLSFGNSVRQIYSIIKTF